MIVACPTCGRTTHLEGDIGDFPTRCERCGGLLRRPPATGDSPGESSPGKRVRGLSLRRTAAAPGTPRGVLAGILSSRPSTDERPALVIRSGAAQPTAAFVSPQPTAAACGTLRVTSRRAIARVRHRQKALRRAFLRGEVAALGTLGWAGLVLVGSLAIFVVALEVHALWRHPAPLRTDTLQADMP